MQTNKYVFVIAAGEDKYECSGFCEEISIYNSLTKLYKRLQYIINKRIAKWYKEHEICIFDTEDYESGEYQKQLYESFPLTIKDPNDKEHPLYRNQNHIFRNFKEIKKEIENTLIKHGEIIENYFDTSDVRLPF